MPRGKKDPNKPKGVKSAYIFFVEHQRAEQDKKGEQLPFTELSKKCGVMWGEMSDSDKKLFVKLSEQDRIRHTNEMRNYTPPEKPSDSDSDDDDRPKRKKKKKKDPNAPKKPTSAYFYFAADARPEIKRENGSLAITEMATIIGQKWRQLSAEDRIPYEEQAVKDKARYLEELAVYNGTK